MASREDQLLRLNHWRVGYHASKVVCPGGLHGLQNFGNHMNEFEEIVVLSLGETSKLRSHGGDFNKPSYTRVASGEIEILDSLMSSP